MAKNILKTQIALLYKTYEEWNDAKNADYIPLKGEVCFCEVPVNSDIIVDEPCILLKVGNGSTAFKNLPWVSAIAADVYAWAKKEHLDFDDLSEEFFKKLDARVSSNEAIKAEITSINEKLANITGAMHFIGVTKKQKDDSGNVTESDIEAIEKFLKEKELTVAAGDLIIVDLYEYVYDGNDWVRLGDDSVNHVTQEQLKLTNDRIDDLQDEIVDLAPIAKTGNVNDLKQSSGDVLILNCNEPYSVTVNGKYYTSIQQAFDAIPNNKATSVELVEDVDLEEPLQIESTKIIELVLNNHTIKNKDTSNTRVVATHTIINKGELTISGKGVVDNISNQKAAVYNDVGAKLTLNGGTYTRSKETGVSVTESGGNSYYTIRNYGELTINAGVEVNQGPNNAGKHSSLITNGWYNISSLKNEPTPIEGTAAKLIINGGKFSGGLITIKNDDNSELIINDGEFNNYAQCVVFNNNLAALNGGVFNAENTSDAAILTRAIDTVYDKGITRITGGSYSSTSGSVRNIEMGATPSLEITGGKFIDDVSAYVKEPHVCVLENNFYVVK